ncbi:MAG TPA: TonB-dependent receptor [Bryobacteraceae bacterium]|nr:TonB-dependent receptor [Bryobacteraceae bacterium]
MKLGVVCLLCLTPLYAQTVSTEILGLVSDSSGAVISGATVTARRVSTGDIRRTLSNETGNYSFPLLDVGEYEVTCTMAGFKTDVVRSVVLQVNQKARLDFSLQLGAQAETVQVVANAPVLRTEDAALGAVVDGKRIVELPLNGRNLTDLASLTPGVVTSVGRGISANGQRGINQNVTLDGVVATQAWTNTTTFNPSIDAVEEFKVQTAVYSAEYGMQSGAQVNVVVKSGTNQFHGTAFEFLRNDMFDARGFFLPNSQPKNKLRRNQFGGVFSGPIIRDRTFFLFNYDGTRENRATPASASVPTEAMRRGDFSELLIPGNRWYPNDANPAATRAIRMPGSTTPFPNNIIPPSLLNQTSLRLLNNSTLSPFSYGGYLPLPNHDDVARATRSPINLIGTNDTKIVNDGYIGRVDHRLTDNDRLFGRYALVDVSTDTTPLNPVGISRVPTRAQNLAIGYTKIITPTVLNEFRFGWNAATNDTFALFSGSDFLPQDIGLDFRVVGDNNRTLTPSETGIPEVVLTGYSSISVNGLGGKFERMHVLEYSDNLMVTRGRHNFKFGGMVRQSVVDRAEANLARGRITFNRDIAGIPDSFAAFMLGIPVSAETAEGVPPVYARQNKYGFYALDDWKATSKLTINFGIRWDIFGGVTDNQGRLRTLSIEGENLRTINGRTAPTLIPNPGKSELLYDVNYRQFMPRLGIAYRVTDKTVIRTGAGLFYDAQIINNFTILNNQPPFAGSALAENNKTNPTATIDKPFAGQTAQLPIALVMLGNLKENNRPYYLNNSIWQWTFEVERAIFKDTVIGIGYVGSKTSHLDYSYRNWNTPPPGLGDIQSRRPYPFYVDSRDPNTLLPLGIVRRLDTSKNANYNALQIRAEKRYSAGFVFNASYNFQKALGTGYGVNDNAGSADNWPQDPLNHRLDYGRTPIDRRHRFVASNVWDIPWLRNNRGFLGQIFGGWSINNIIQLTSGAPVTINQAGDSHNTGAFSNPRPHILPGQTVERVWENRSLDQWFNTAAFVRSKCNGCPGEGIYDPTTLGYGNAGVALVDAPAQKLWDLSLLKEFGIREGHRLQFRWEAFNFTNTPQFAAPGRTLGNATFGRITSTASNNREMQLALKYMF